MSYRNLEIWQRARQIAIDVHRMSLRDLPKYEMYEEGTQIRRSAHSIRSNIVEGYGRRRYKLDYIKFLTCSLASCDETTDHLEALRDTGSLANATVYDQLHADLQILGKKLNLFLQSVERQHEVPLKAAPRSPRPVQPRPEPSIQHPASRTQNP